MEATVVHANTLPFKSGHVKRSFHYLGGGGGGGGGISDNKSDVRRDACLLHSKVQL